MTSHYAYSVRIVSLSDPSFDIDLYHQSLSLRHRVLVREQGWPLPSYNELESDQYDTLFAHHVVLINDGDVVGTLRLLPTNVDLFGTTYMILDANRGVFPDMPTGLLDEEIIDPEVWEASRLAICSSIPVEERNRVLEILLHTSIEFLKKEHGVKSLLGLMHPVFQKTLSRAGITSTIIGPVKDQTDGKICVLRYDF